MKEFTLLVLAAGMGSRFGGMKQMTPIDEHNNFIIDYSVYDAIRAGFNHVCFVIKKEMQNDFEETIGDRVKDRIKTSIVFQDVSDVPKGFKVPAGREKPWGTAHAVLCAREAIKGPFASINSDDFYGQSAYTEMFAALSALNSGQCCMPGYLLKNTLSKSGPVSRGICQADETGRLLRIEEHHKVERKNGHAIAENSKGRPVTLLLDSLTSLNIWGFCADIFDSMEQEFHHLLNNLSNPLKDEFYIPGFVDSQSEKGRLEARLWRTNAEWSGITFRSDLEELIAKAAEYRRAGVYPDNLWGAL